MTSNSPANANHIPQQENVRALFTRLKRIRNISLGIGAVGTSVLIGSAYKPIHVGAMTAAVTLTTLSLSTAGTAQLLLSLNTQLENVLNAPPKTEQSA